MAGPDLAMLRAVVLDGYVMPGQSTSGTHRTPVPAQTRSSGQAFIEARTLTELRLAGAAVFGLLALLGSALPGAFPAGLVLGLTVIGAVLGVAFGPYLIVWSFQHWWRLPLLVVGTSVGAAILIFVLMVIAGILFLWFILYVISLMLE